MKSRSYGLDFLKAMATIAIVFHHFQQDFEIVYDNHINFYYGWFYWGNMVELFFLLSGYFMFRYIPRILDGEFSLVHWTGKRIKRLLPLAAVSAVCYEILFILYWYVKRVHWIWNREFTIWGILLTALGLNEGGAFVNPRVNNITWYISVLIICYCVFYVITKLAQKLRCSPFYCYAFMVLLGVSIITAKIDLPYLNSFTARGYRSFFYGVLLAKMIHTYGITRKEVLASCAVLGVFAFLAVFRHQMLITGMDNLLCFVVFPALVVLFESEIGKKLFCHPVWQLWGNVSYNVYIWHVIGYMFLDLLFYVIGFAPDLSHVGWMYGYVLLIEAFGVVSHFFIEKPLNSLLEKICDDYRQRRMTRAEL